MKSKFFLPAVLTAVFCFFIIGFYTGRNTVSGVVMEKPVSAQDVSALQSSSVPTEPAEESQDAININTASASELEALPGIGSELAGRIVRYRERFGSFITKEQIMEVEGIGNKKFEAIQSLITLGR